MKKYIIGGLFSLAVFIGGLSLFANTAEAGRVSGYYRNNGTYVQPYYRSSPNNSRYDNYSTKGNYNPYTGSKGYKSPHRW